MKDKEEAMEYAISCSHGIVRSLHEIRKILKLIHDKSDDENIQLLAESALIKCEAQLDY